MDPLIDLTDKVAVITGGSRGIGRAIAFAYAEHGADVVIASRKFDNCKAVAAEIAEATGRRALPVATHVGRWDECNALADTVLEEFGRCDILVNNAGMSPLYDRVTDITEEYYDKVTSVNLKGPFALSLRLGGHMMDNDGGSIINVSTIGSIRPSRAEVVYGMAKSGLNAMTVALADAMGPKVRVNCILPGAILTDISKAWSPETIERAHDTPMGRAGYAEDFAGAALFFAGPASEWITGTCLRVDGGMARQLGL
ncbi:MAG: SDR family NAD(P)-dependent oxidoreductase [Acidimicrobiales bacterium]